MAAARKHWLPVALLCACMASLAQAAILPTDLEARVGANYEPVDADEREIWQSLARLEAGIRTSPQRVIAPELDAYTRGVVERLIGRPAPELRTYVMRDASFNASMFPSGMMIVNTGLLARIRNEAQFAAVLGHEAGHSALQLCVGYRVHEEGQLGDAHRRPEAVRDETRECRESLLRSGRSPVRSTGRQCAAPQVGATVSRTRRAASARGNSHAPPRRCAPLPTCCRREGR